MTEQQLRRLAKKHGLIIQKARSRENIDNLGGYMIVNALTNVIESGERYNLSLEEVEECLKS